MGLGGASWLKDCRLWTGACLRACTALAAALLGAPSASLGLVAESAEVDRVPPVRSLDRLVFLYEEILAELVEASVGTEETPTRAAKALLEVTEGYETDVASLFTVFNSEGYDQMVLGRGIPFYSTCEH